MKKLGIHSAIRKKKYISSTPVAENKLCRHFYASTSNGKWATEGFWGIIKSVMYQMYEITDESSLRFAITDYIRFYCKERSQVRYHCKTPLEVRMEALSSETTIPYS